MTHEAWGGPADALVEGVERQTRAWRLFAGWTVELFGLAREQPHPGVFIAAVAFEVRDRLRAYALARYGVRVGKHDSEDMTRITLDVPEPRRLPHDLAPDEMHRQLRELLHWVRIWDAAAAACVLVSTDAEAAGESFDVVDGLMFDAVARVVEVYPPMAIGKRIDTAPGEDALAEAALEMAGWARAHLSALVNQRLAAFLRTEGRPAARVLGETLPGAALTSWADRRRGEPLVRGKGNLLARMVAALEVKHPRDRQLDHERAVLGRAFTETDAALLWDLVERAKLSQREREVLDLRLKETPYAEIAAVLRISESTVRAHWHNAATKVKKLVDAA